MRIIIAGGRDFNNYNLLEKSCLSIIKQLNKEEYNTNNIKIISGRAKGADQLGEEFGKAHKFNIEYFPADWNNLEAEPCLVRTNQYGEYNVVAGMNRNRERAKYTSEDPEIGILIAFWDKKSKGTKNMIKLAKEYGLKVFVVNYVN